MNEHNFPPHFIASLSAENGFDEENFVKAHRFEEAPTSIRVNPFKPSALKNTQNVPWCANGYYLESRPSFTFDPLFMPAATMYRKHHQCLLIIFLKQKTKIMMMR
ncbi:hypothetical protein ACFJIV_33795 [Mucilaginibacter sp. UC70_90]